MFHWARPVDALLALSAIELVVACAGAPSAAPAIAAGAASIEAARASGAADHAAVYLTTAQSKLERARVLARDGETREAARLAQQADLDAQFARALAGASRAQRTAEEVGNSVKAAREEAERRPAGVVVSPVAPRPAPTSAPVPPQAPASAPRGPS